MKLAGVPITWLAAALALTIGIAACGSDDADDASDSKPAGTAGAGATQAKQELDELYKGTFGQPPESSPAPPKDKHLWVISCNQAVTACSIPAQAQKEAGEALGWKVTVWDGKSDPSQYLAGLRQAITAKADAITGFAIDCPSIKSGLQEAKRAGIPFVAVEAFDCSDVKPGAPSLFTYVVHYSGVPYVEWIESYGAAQATWNIARQDGKAKVIVFFENDAQALVAIDRGFREKLAGCSGCEIVETVTFTAADLGPKLQEKAQQALLQHPDANGIQIGYDALLTSGILPALRSSGRLSQMQIMGAEGAPPNIKLIRDDQGQDAGVGTPPAWEGYAAVDAVVRILAGEKPDDQSGLGIQVFDRDHNLPDSGPFVPVGADGAPIDFAAAYQAAWKQGG